MFGKESRVSPRQSRKRLLVAESEINRVQMSAEWQAITAEIKSVTSRAKSVGSLASVAAVLVTGLSAFRRGKSVSTGAKSSWFQSALNGAQLAGSLWLAYRARKR